MSDERKEIAERVQQFRAMQEGLAREREDRMNRQTKKTRAMLKEMREKLKSS